MSTEKGLMTHGPIAKQMLLFAFPIFLGQLFQQLYNTMDSLIVGNFVSSQALAAVSSSGNIIFLIIGFFNGMAMGAGVIISNAYGANDTFKMKRTIATLTVLGLLIGAFLMVFATAFTPWLLRVMNTPESVMPESITYFSIYFFGSIGLVEYNFISAILRAVGNSKSPLYFLMASSITNIALDLFFIVNLDWGVAGAAWATILSQYLSAILCFYKLYFTDGPARITFKETRMYWSDFTEILHYGLPTGVQNSIISLANVIVQSQINTFGDLAMAGCGVYSKIEGFAFLPIMAFNISISTFVAQNAGAAKLSRAKKGAIYGILFSMVFAEAVGVLFAAFSRQLIAFFDATPKVIDYGSGRAVFNGPFYFLLAFSHAMSSVFRGREKPVVSMLVMLICWTILRVSILTLMLMIRHNILFVYLVYPITWTASSLIFAIMFKKLDWKENNLEAEYAREGV